MTERVDLLGGSRVVLEDGTPVQLRPTMRDQALAFLAYSGSWVTRDRLGFLFWADEPDDIARHNVRQLLKRMRRLRWLDRLETDEHRVRWLVPTDIDEFHEAVSRGQWDAVPADAELLSGFERKATPEYEEWLLAERRQISERWLTARLAASTAAADEGDPARGAALLEPILDHPEGDRVLLQYMELAVQAGDSSSARSAFDRAAIRAHDELGVDPPAPVRQLAARLRAEEETDTRVPDRLVGGRQNEVRELADLLARPSCRIVTLLGPGGIGKSTLATLLAERLSKVYDDGASVVPLDAVRDAAAVPAAIAANVHITLDGRLDPVDQVVAALRRTQMLLVLDNVEHLSESWNLVPTLLAECPRLKVIVTSRERLHLDDEWVYDVPGLSDLEAVDLFARRARRVAPQTTVKREDALAVCRAVGGSPLGIELAVPWLRLMSARQVAAEIDRDAAILQDGTRDTHPRHRSLQAAMDHSWKLITDEERDAVEALSVFAVPYSLDQAVRVAELSAVVLLALVDKSLVHRVGDDRYGSHPLVRQYAASQLGADDERQQHVRHRHAQVVLGGLMAYDRSAPVDEVVTAWIHAIDHRDLDLIRVSARALATLLDAKGRYRQGIDLIREAAALLPPGTDVPDTVGPLRLAEAVLLFGLGHHAEAARAAEEAQHAFRDTGNPAMLAYAGVLLGWARKGIDGDAGQYEATLDALPAAQAVGSDELMAEVLNGLGCSAPSLDQCHDYLMAALAHAHDASPVLQHRVRSSLGLVCWSLGDHVAAIEHLTRSVEIAREADLRSWLGRSLATLAFVHADAGHLDMADELAREADLVSEPLSATHNGIWTTVLTGEIRRLVGDTEGARGHAHQALRAAESIGSAATCLRALRLHGQLLVDSGAVEDGLRELAFVLAHTDRRGDFTCEILNPRIWESTTAHLDDAIVEHSQLFAAGQTREAMVSAALAHDQRCRN